MRKALSVLLMSALAVLTACGRAPAPEASKRPTAAPSPAWQPLAAQDINLHLTGRNCDDRCAEFQATWLHFPDAPALDAELLQQIDAPMRPGVPVKDIRAVLQQMASDLLADAASYREPWSQILVLKQRQGLGHLVVLDLIDEQYTGGAHGTSTVAYVQWDRQGGRIVHLADLLLPAQTEAFWQAARRAHVRWLKQQPDAASLEAGWPFEKTDNVALLPDGLVLKYQPYSIGPYAIGTPELHIPLDELKGIIRPEWLASH